MRRSSVWLAIMLVFLFILCPQYSNSESNADFQQNQAPGFPAHTLGRSSHSTNALSVALLPLLIWLQESGTVDEHDCLLLLFTLSLRKRSRQKSTSMVKRRAKTTRFAIQGYRDHPHHAPPCFAGS
jgi:hypothetical protein